MLASRPSSKYADARRVSRHLGPRVTVPVDGTTLAAKGTIYFTAPCRGRIKRVDIMVGTAVASADISVVTSVKGGVSLPAISVPQQAAGNGVALEFTDAQSPQVAQGTVMQFKVNSAGSPTGAVTALVQFTIE